MRIPALDFTKGALVLFMILYHWINYFIGLQWPYYRYLRFLTPSFIFITGFVISNVYLSKYDVGDARLVARLVIRGFKLIAIFIALNVFRDCVIPILSTGSVAPDLLETTNLTAIFVTGTFTGKVVAFYVLVPIAYLLILSGVLMLPLRAFRYTFHVTCASLFVAIAVLGLGGRNNHNLEMLAIGVLGILAGLNPIAAVNKVVRHPYILVVSYLLYTIAIATWNVPYSLEVVGTLLTVTIIYLVATIGSKANWFRDELVFIGKYSLFAYIAQIVILQLLAAGFRHLDVGDIALVISFPAGFGLTVIAIELVHRARVRAARIDRLYKALFN
jgi:hypothetical protein